MSDARMRVKKLHTDVGQGGSQKGEYIPFEYDFETVKAYYDKRPTLVACRIKEVLAES
jgi:hypothetical protein